MCGGGLWIFTRFCGGTYSTAHAQGQQLRTGTVSHPHHHLRLQALQASDLASTGRHAPLPETHTQTHPHSLKPTPTPIPTPASPHPHCHSAGQSQLLTARPKDVNNRPATVWVAPLASLPHASVSLVCPFPPIPMGKGSCGPAAQVLHPLDSLSSPQLPVFLFLTSALLTTSYTHSKIGLGGSWPGPATTTVLIPIEQSLTGPPRARRTTV